MTEAYRGTYFKDRPQKTKMKNNKIKKTKEKPKKMNILKHALLVLLIPITTFLTYQAISYFQPNLQTLCYISATLTIILIFFSIYLLNKTERYQNHVYFYNFNNYYKLFP